MIRSRVGFAFAGVVVIAGLLAATAFAAEGRKPDATVTLSEGSVAAGIGWSWGHGTLHYQGKDYDLKSLADFDGVYGAAGAGIAVQEGKGATALINPKKVQIVLTSKTKGATLKVAAEGLKVKLEK